MSCVPLGATATEPPYSSHYAPCNFVLLLKMVFKLRTAFFTRCGDAAHRTNPQVHVGKKAI